MDARDGGRAARTIIVWACLAGLGGACARFAPTVPMRARADDAEVQLAYVRATPKRQFVLRSRTTAPHALRHAWLTVATRQPCSGGVEALELAVDEGRTADGGLTPGEHQLDLRFPGALDDFTLDLVIDLGVDADACWRVSVVSQNITFEPTNRWSVSGATTLAGNADLRGLRSVVDVRVGGAYWAGPLQLGAQVGMGASVCSEGTCGRDAQNNLRSGLAASLTVEGRGVIARGRPNHMTSAALAGLRYSALSVGLPASDGDRRFTLHAVQGVLGWAIGDRFVASLRHMERAQPYEISVPIGMLIDPSGPRKVGFTVGMEVRFNAFP